MANEKNKSVWIAVKNGRGEVKGYFEHFKNNAGVTMSIPGKTRWIEGSDFDLAKAKLISDDDGQN